MKRLIYVGVALLLCGCASKIHETHYYATYAPGEDTPKNFVRLSVDGQARFSSSRFVAGFYDERAVDLFFSEMKTSKNQNKPDNPATPTPLFPDNKKDPGGDDTIKPLSPSAEQGAFVLILSSNADSVVNTIGSFAESEVVAEAISNMISSDTIKAKQKSDAALPIQKAQGIAQETQVRAQLNAAKGAASAAEAEAGYLRALTTLARALGYNGGFADFDAARAWFELERKAQQ